LVADDLAVVLMDLLIVEMGMIRRGFRIGLIAVGEELCAIRVLVGVRGRRVVAKADGFASLARLLLGGGKVGLERWVVGVFDCWRGGGGVVTELGGELGELGV
jgi:hypothetical protein